MTISSLLFNKKASRNIEDQMTQEPRRLSTQAEKKIFKDKVDMKGKHSIRWFLRVIIEYTITEFPTNFQTIEE